MLSLSSLNPFDEFQRELDSVFGRSWVDPHAGRSGSWMAATEVTSGEEGWKVRMALPGIDPKEVHVDLQGNMLTVTGERAVNEKGVEQSVSEIGYGRFERSFALPRNVETSKVSASFENGMLELTLPVSEESKPRRIEIGTTVQNQLA